MNYVLTSLSSPPPHPTSRTFFPRRTSASLTSAFTSSSNAISVWLSSATSSSPASRKRRCGTYHLLSYKPHTNGVHPVQHLKFATLVPPERGELREVRDLILVDRGVRWARGGCGGQACGARGRPWDGLRRNAGGGAQTKRFCWCAKRNARHWTEGLSRAVTYVESKLLDVMWRTRRLKGRGRTQATRVTPTAQVTISHRCDCRDLRHSDRNACLIKRAATRLLPGDRNIIPLAH